MFGRKFNASNDELFHGINIVNARHNNRIPHITREMNFTWTKC